MRTRVDLDVLSVGHAAYDQLFKIPHHPSRNEKLSASSLTLSGGGPAANAAVLVARLGLRSGFSGYLGCDLYGDRHLQELMEEGVDVLGVVRGQNPTPLSVILTEPQGERALVNFKGDTVALASGSVDLSDISASVLLFDGHEPFVAEDLLQRPVPKVLDAGSLHDGTRRLMGRVDHLVVSERFALQWIGREDPKAALLSLSEYAPVVVVTLGAGGLIWKRGGEEGAMAAFEVDAIDSTGAGDAFHGAYAAGLAEGLAWLPLLRWASAAGALCCQTLGARPGLPSREAMRLFLKGSSGWDF